MKFILGTKIGMTQVFRPDGTVVPVTRVQAGPCVVTQVKTAGVDRASAVQVGFGAQKLFRLNKAEQGHLRDLPPVKHLHDFRGEHNLTRGDVLDVSLFAAGEKVQVTGNSKGKGFQGVVKRHKFHGSPATHGHKDQQRMPGSIGATGPQRVFKGMRMAGHMGDAQITVKNLEVVEVHGDVNELWIKGAVPGARGGIIVIATEQGTMTPTGSVFEKKQEESVADEAAHVEAVPAETPVSQEAPVEEVSG